jgi:hypothetical protein
VSKLLRALLATVVLAACSSGAATPDPPAVAPLVRHGFLGAFFRPVGVIPYGVFSVYSKQRAPEPYPSPRTTLFGKAGYCDAVAPNGVSISSGYQVDAAKLANAVNLGVSWTRSPISSDNDDQSQSLGARSYLFGDADSAQCALIRAKIEPIVGLEAGPVHYNSAPGVFSPKELPGYKTAADFGAWCSAVALHERKTFPSVHRFSVPGNEVNSAPEMFPGGDAQIAAYTQACYHALKVQEPNSTIYGFELNMDRKLDPAGFVQRMYDLGCKAGTCYDAISLHLFMRYPLPAPGAACTGLGAQYSMQCVADVQKATHAASMHILIGEFAFTVPGSVPDEATKATAVVGAMKQFAQLPLVDGVNYANVDECDLYPSGFFSGGCLVDSVGNKLPAYTALQALADKYYRSAAVSDAEARRE